MRTVAGRLGMSYRYSKELVYNTFPWPDSEEKEKSSIEEAARAVLEERKKLEGVCSLADMYDPVWMKTTGLYKAHRHLDAAVEKLYRKTPFADDAERLAFLFARYQKLTAFVDEKSLKR